ncbi:MAG: cytochrome c biogenesis protein CcdA [Thermoleophilia bacterium]|nr:cytochrome c biogenesis protein CcdA [Thermoleophilia bacterium]
MDIAGLPIFAAIAVSAAAGAMSFLSPCVAPLLPGYVAFVGGASADDSDHGALPRALGFVAGFIVLFALLGASAAAFSRQLNANRDVLELVCGLLVALLGLAMAFDRSIVPASLGGRLQQRNARLGSPATALAAMPVGAAFAVAWSPCIGPALAAILALAAGSADPGRGAILLVAYGVGLGVPFILGAVALDRVHAISSRVRAHARGIRITGGVLLVVLGIAIATGLFGQLAAHLARVVPGWLG